MDSRSLKTIDARIPTAVPRRSTSGFHRSGGHRVHQARWGMLPKLPRIGFTAQRPKSPAARPPARLVPVRVHARVLLNHGSIRWVPFSLCVVRSMVVSGIEHLERDERVKGARKTHISSIVAYNLPIRCPNFRLRRPSRAVRGPPGAVRGPLARGLTASDPYRSMRHRLFLVVVWYGLVCVCVLFRPPADGER